MTETKNLPTQLTDQSLVPFTGKHHSLVARGMLELSKENNDAIYRQARKTYNEITDNGTISWCGAEERKVPMAKVFKVFQNLAEKGYGKAFFPLSTIYQGEQSIEGDLVQAKYYREHAFDWLHSNEHLNDPEIWCDLGILYMHDDNQLVVHYFQKGADVHDPNCMWMLSDAYAFGAEVEQDWNEAQYWQIKAAMAGHAKAQHGLEIQHDRGDLDIDDKQVFDWYTWSAGQGYVWAQVLLADTYFAGHTMESYFEGKKEYCSYWHDEEQAVYWYEKAAIQGDPHAQLQLGKMYWHGMSCIEQDYEQAKYWLEKSIEQNNPEAQHQSGLFLFDMGEVEQAIMYVQYATEQDYGPAQYDYALLLSQDNDDLSDEDLEHCCDLFESAFIWYFERISESGDLELRYDYAMMHLNNWNNWQINKHRRANRYKGLSLLREIADEPSPIDIPLPAYDIQRRACRTLGKKLLNDNPEKEQVLEAIHWLSKAVKLGDVNACTDLAELYLYGHAGGGSCREPQVKLVEIDQKLAVYWYERGVQLGWCTASYELGSHYLEGKHLPQDLALAEKWLIHSAKEGSSFAPILLGMEYASGARLHQNSDPAIYWLIKATESDSRAFIELAKIHFDGKIISRDFEKAINWLSRLRDEKNIRWNDAIKLIAEKCFDGRFNTRQETTAQEWIEETASMLEKRVSDTDDHMYMCRTSNLAELYELGLGVEKDMEKAIHWYRQSGSYRAKEHLRELGIE